MIERAERRGMRPPRAAPAAELHRLGDGASATMRNRACPDATFQACPPNGLAFSCRERAGTSFSKLNDLAREAVGCNAGLGGAGGPIPSH